MFVSLNLAAAAYSPLLAQDAQSATVTSSHASESEPDIQAALILKIGKFVRWPAGAFGGYGGTLRLCVAGADDLGPSIDRLSGRKLRGQVISVHHLPDGAAGVGCHMLFVGRSASERLPELLQTIASAPVLTISDMAGFNSRGGMIALKSTGAGVRFAINTAASNKAGLVFGAPLLQLAVAMNDAQRPDLSR